MARSNVIPFRLRPGRDDDIVKALGDVPEDVDRSHVIRTALRAYLGLSNAVAPYNSMTRQEGVKRVLKATILQGVELTAAEKSPDQLADALDKLLDQF
jgi:hypothetical protein